MRHDLHPFGCRPFSAATRRPAHGCVSRPRLMACIVCGKSLAFHSPPVWCSRPTSNSCPPMSPVQFVAYISQARGDTTAQPAISSLV